MRIFWQGLILCVFTGSGCSSLKKQAVSNYLGQFQDKKASGVYFEKLPQGYQRQAHSALDELWWNESLNSSISYFSSCSKWPKNLEDFQTSTYPLKYKRIQFSKKADRLYSVLEVSQSQNNKTYMAIYTLQKKNCYFNINLVVHSLSSFKSEEPLFKKFIKSFNYK